MSLCTKLHAEMQEIAGNAMEVWDVKNMRNSASTRYVDFARFGSNHLKELFIKSNTLLGIKQQYKR